MAAQLDVKVLHADTTIAYLKALQRGINRESVRMVHAASIFVQGKVRQHAAGKSVGGPRSGAFRNRGNLARSWQVGSVEVSGDSVTGTVGSNSPYAKIHETGGTITPKAAGALTIPLDPRASRKRASDFPRDKTALIKVRGNAFIILNEGRRTIFLFLLKKSVTLKPRHYITNAMREAQPGVEKILGHSAEQMIRGPQ